MLIAAIAIKATSGGPVIFSQLRSGLGGKPFKIYKLRTMELDAEEKKAESAPLSEQDGPAFKIKDDPRITRVGRYLRKTCIDELPQLWNVLIGDMTLVGPRPLPCDESAACENWERQRLDVTPGLTCVWQVRSGRARIPVFGLDASRHSIHSRPQPAPRCEAHLEDSGCRVAAPRLALGLAHAC